MKGYHGEQLIANLKPSRENIEDLALMRIAKVGCLTMNMNDKRVFVERREVKLTEQEFLVLWLLVVNKNKIVNRDEIVDFLPNTSSKSHRNLVNVLICKIRKKIRVVPDGDIKLQTVWDSGYLLIEGTSTVVG